MIVRFFSVFAVLALLAAPASAQWNLLSDFDSLTLGPLGTQGGWTADSDINYNVVADPDDAANQVVEVSSDGGNAFIALGSGIPDGATSTLFFRIRNDATGDLVFGSSDMPAPSGWGDYEGYMRAAAGNLDVRTSGGFNPGPAYQGDTWTNIWLVLDNANDMTTMYSSAGSPVSGDFRNGTGDPLVTANIRAGGGQVDNLGYIDDVYLSEGVNLTNPVPEPSAVVVLIAAFVVGLVAKRS